MWRLCAVWLSERESKLSLSHQRAHNELRIQIDEKWSKVKVFCLSMLDKSKKRRASEALIAEGPMIYGSEIVNPSLAVHVLRRIRKISLSLHRKATKSF